MKNIPGGFYCVLEGPDGCGKSTQADLLQRRLALEYSVLSIREPGSTPLGDSIRSIVLEEREHDLDAVTEALLFNASRSFMIKTKVLPALSEGRVVVSDRNYWSTLAYQCGGGKLDLQRTAEVCRFATHGVSPDLIILNDIDSEFALKRASGGQHDKIESRGLEYHRRVREIYLQLARENPQVAVIIDPSKVVDEVVRVPNSSRSIDEIHEEIYQVAKKRIDEKLAKVL